MKRVSITGTESTGKTTLAEQLARQFAVPLVADVSRQYIAALNRPYTEQDVLEIAKQIIEAEDNIPAGNMPFVISDNDLINIKIWLQYYNWEVPAWLQEQIIARKCELYLLCFTDTAWLPDAQRANPHDRDDLFGQFVKELNALQANYKVLKGNEMNRLNEAGAWIEKKLI
jgi:nicotinamide riboside kinase